MIKKYMTTLKRLQLVKEMITQLAVTRLSPFQRILQANCNRFK